MEIAHIAIAWLCDCVCDSNSKEHGIKTIDKTKQDKDASEISSTMWLD